MDMVEWCERINAIDGLCTVQSCAGHVVHGVSSCGHLWIAMSDYMSARFDELAFDLSAQPGIERVYRLYSSWGQEIVCIEFEGDERGHLHSSMQTILEFLNTTG